MNPSKDTRRAFLKSVGLGAAALAGRSCARADDARSGKRPNILYIMADDHTTQAFGCYGSRLAKVSPTKNIDRLASQGMRLDACFCTNSICVPSRASILTGQYSHVNKVYTLADKIDPARQNVAKLLRAGGYQTAIVGKWHLKTRPSGFDYWNVLPGQGRYHNPILTEIGRDRKVHQGYVTDIITGLALDWLRKRDTRKPFFLMCHFKSPHGPWHYAKRFKKLFADVTIPEPKSLFEDLAHRSDGSREYGFTIETLTGRMGKKGYPTGRLDVSGLSAKEARRATYQKYLKDYLRCIAGNDGNVGRLLKYLDDKGLADNTVVIYTSDQGFFLGEHNYIDKRWIFEEALRMPFVVRYPPEIKPGSTNDDIIINTDFAGTFLDYAGLKTPADMQGRSFRPNLRGRTPDNWRTSMYYRYWQHCSRPAHYGVRTRRYKLIFFYGLGLGLRGSQKKPTKVGWELYDLQKDPAELRNVYGSTEYASVVRELKGELLRLKKELKDSDRKYPELMAVRARYWD